jgi:hypothetical protein
VAAVRVTQGGVERCCSCCWHAVPDLQQNDSAAVAGEETGTMAWSITHGGVE